ncbi:MAG: autotransporter outer membrane beta-barrel domain-containing protein, partial [Alphaproteobacteria bacterium]|nr:autotransporter outer membrane beta-barrel domain-containing protein [Alphaproteobacteria bacterium]
TFDGDIINDGLIEGLGVDTGLHIVTGTHIGNIINNNYGTLSASSNALHLEIGNLTGSIVNTGTIQVNDGNTAVLLDIASDATFINTDGGLILGNVALNDIVFNGKASHSFIGEDGGIVGSIVGDPDSFGGEGGPINDDFVIVRNGTQYFLDDGAEGLSGLSDLAAFNINSGGTAVMGAEFVGDPNGTGYTSDNVDALNVNAGGTLYIDKQTELNVGTYTQSADGTLAYFLQAPGSSPSALASPSLSVQSTAIATPGVDYGQIFVDGVATLNGSISAYLDPSSFASTLYDEIIYNDVIDATGGISGDFTNVELFSNSSIFQLSHVIDGNTVDLTVARTSLAHLGGLSGIVIETAGPWKSMVNDRSNGIGSGSCGLAGGGWCFNRFAANEPGATSVMNDATPGDDPFAWLRTGVRRVGETAAWGRLVGVIGETDGDIGVAGTDFQLAGAIAGIDHVFTPILLAGAAAQFTTQDIDFDGRPDNAQVDSFELGAYMSYGDTRLYLNANASFIWHDIDVNRFVGADVANGKYNGTTISGYVEGGKIFETEQGVRIQPLVAVSYAHLETDGYSETGPAVTKLDVFGSEFDSLKGMLGARFAYPIQMDSGRKLVPEARIIWSHEFMDDQSSFLADAQGGPFAPQLVTGEEYSRDTIILGTGLTAPLSEATSLFFDYDAGLSEDVTTHTLSAGFRTRW